MAFTIFAISLLLGIVAGLRTMMPLAAVSWAAAFGWLPLDGTWLWWLGHPWAPWILTAAAIGELVTDQLPSTPSRTVPVQFGARLISGGLAGAAIGMPSGAALAGTIAGVVGAVAGTVGGRAFRARLAAAFRRDPPAALIEDAIAIAAAAAAVLSLA